MTYLFLIGRILFGGFFLMNGFNHFTKHAMMRGYTKSKGLPLPGAAVFLSGVVLFLGGFSLILGAYVGVAMWLLVLFLALAAFLFHDFWTVMDPQQRMMQMLMFMRNIALIGALFMLLTLPTPWVLGF